MVSSDKWRITEALERSWAAGDKWREQELNLLVVSLVLGVLQAWLWAHPELSRLVFRYD